MSNKNTIVVNLFAGAGAGKSTVMAETFAKLKWNEVDVEMATEFIKEAIWEKRPKIPSNQALIFGEQYYRISRLLGEVDVVITDSPILLSRFYNSDLSVNFDNHVFDVFNSLNNVNYFIERKKKYNPNGRFQSENEAKALDVVMMEMLDNLSIPYKVVEGLPNVASEFIKDDILKLLRVPLEIPQKRYVVITSPSCAICHMLESKANETGLNTVDFRGISQGPEVADLIRKYNLKAAGKVIDMEEERLLDDPEIKLLFGL